MTKRTIASEPPGSGTELFERSRCRESVLIEDPPPFVVIELTDDHAAA
jgi:hypothetical protein